MTARAVSGRVLLNLFAVSAFVISFVCSSVGDDELDPAAKSSSRSDTID